ncbi:MOSC domain-containing protein [Glutamicibacter sp.]|uniref:MOSC domain-containing protein n=1 Tax=Glutamicibacter sp. TaxID=1931995 RepID=UPI0028BE0801|nr:2Fe-2S iron-sulfur cluster-binding protein [Glutamicibacter sp.]
MRIDRLFRFPFKGLPAEEITTAAVELDGGLAGDRIAAFSNGTSEVSDGQWQSCLTFTILKNNKSLQKWSVSSQPPLITVTAPGVRESLTFDSSSQAGRSEANRYFTAHIPAQGKYPRQVVSAGRGMFDSQHSGLSFINPNTVKVLSAASGVDLDPLRYRGNVLLEGLPAFAEFDLIGKVMRIGEVRIAVTKSIERCTATSVNPTSTEVDVNGPRLLAAHFGHLHCGIYGTVLSPGQLHTGAEIIVEESSNEAAARVPRKSTPRYLTVVKHQEIDNGAFAITLRDPLGWISDHDEAGKHLRVHLSDPLWRNYTITGVQGQDISLAVRAQGTVSHRMSQLSVGDRVLASGPHGTVTARKVLRGRTALLTAGIGITPALGLLRHRESAHALTELRVVHCERGAGGTLFSALQDTLREVDVPLAVTHFNTATARPTVEQLVEAVRDCDSVVICGPEGFTELALEACHTAGLAPQQIHRETFASPIQDFSELIANYEPADITCSFSGKTFTWDSNDGVLLDSLEAQGLTPSSSCRGGACGECAITLLRGSVTYPIDPSASVEDGQILTCMAVPSENLVLDL